MSNKENVTATAEVSVADTPAALIKAAEEKTGKAAMILYGKDGTPSIITANTAPLTEAQHELISKIRLLACDVICSSSNVRTIEYNCKSDELDDWFCTENISDEGHEILDSLNKAIMTAKDNAIKTATILICGTSERYYRWFELRKDLDTCRSTVLLLCSLIIARLDAIKLYDTVHGKDIDASDPEYGVVPIKELNNIMTNFCANPDIAGRTAYERAICEALREHGIEDEDYEDYEDYIED